MELRSSTLLLESIKSSNFCLRFLLRVEVYEIISPLITTLSVSHSVDAVVDSDLLSNRKLSIAVDTNVQNAGFDNKEVFSLHKGRSLYLKLQIRSNCKGAW